MAELDANDLWNLTDGDHLWVRESAPTHTLAHEIHIVDVEKEEHNDGHAAITISGTILQDERTGNTELHTERDDHVSDWTGITATTNFTDNTEAVVEQIIKIPDPVDNQAWDEHATILKNKTVLSEQEAATQALKERGLPHREIALILNVDKGTVDKYSTRINQKIEQAESTLAQLNS